MFRINIHEAKTCLSRVIARVEKGETAVLCRRNVPVAEIHRVSRVDSRRRPVGLAKGSVKIPKTFFDPLPDDMLDAFEGRSGAR